MEKILVVGAGAIGGITGAFIADKGYDVTLFDVDEKHVDKINKDGLLIDGIREKKRIKVKAVKRIKGKYDVVFIAVKSQYTKDALKRVLPHLNKDGIVVSLQNSINEEVIASKVGIENTIGCVIGWSATNVKAGHLKFTSEGEFIIGKLNGKMDEKVEKVRDLLQNVAPVKVTNNIMGYLWAKLLINSAIASIGAIANANLGGIVRKKKSLVALAMVADELVRVAERVGIELEKFEGLDPSFFKIDSYDDFKRVLAILKIAGKRHAGLRSTILQDLEKGRKTEIDYLNGYVEKKAKEEGIETRLNKEIIKIIKEMEAGKRKPGYENIEDVLKLVNIPQKWLNFKEKELEPALFNLPEKLKFEAAANMAGVFLMGSVAAFSKAFERITSSIIGKLFIRKSEWEISNIVLSKFLENAGENIAKMIKEGYDLKEGANEMAKTMLLFFNNANMENSVKARKGIIEIEARNCIFLNGSEKINIKEKIDFPVCKHLFNGFKKVFKADYEIKDAICKNGKSCVFEIK